jgi:hypothetical protein
MASFAVGEALLDVLVLAHVQNERWSTKHHTSGDYDTWIVPDARIQILSLSTLTKQGHVVRIGGPTSGIFVAGRRDIFIPLFRDGLATAPLAFYNLCVDVFTKVGLQRLRTDECVFIKYA